MVLDQICDGYECLYQITIQLAMLTSRCGLTIETPEVLAALGDLIADGLARAEGIDGMPPIEEIGSPHELGLDDVYFGITDKGMQLQLSDYPDWPFDDNNVPRSDWKPPEG
jgi:hypothetical protein